MSKKKKSTQGSGESVRAELIEKALLKHVSGGSDGPNCHGGGRRDTCRDDSGGNICWSYCCWDHGGSNQLL